MSDSQPPADAYRPPVEAPTELEDAMQVPAAPTKRPRVWTVFLAIVAALVLTVAVQGAVGIVLVAGAIADGVKPQELQDVLLPKLMSPPVFILMLIVGQLAMLATTLIAARLSPVPLVERLGLVKPGRPIWVSGLLVLGSALPLALAVGAAYLMTIFFDPDESVMMLYEQMTNVWAIPFIVAIGVFPGVCEEILFRGYVQRRFIQRWGPWPGIIATSIIFAIFHLTPHAMALALVLGLWLGAIAYRTGSVWPGALCHGCINSGWNVWQVGKQLWGFPETVSPAVAAIGIAVMLSLTVPAIRVLVRPMGQPADTAPSMS